MRLKTKINITVYLLIGFVILSIGLFLFHDDSLFCLSCKIDSLKFSHFGGFLAGVLSSLSIFLILLTFFFNRESREIGMIENYYENLNKEINSAIFNNKKGVEAYLDYELGTVIRNNLLDNLNLVLTNFEIYLDLIENNEIINKKIRNKYLIRFYLLFYAKMLWPLHETIIKNGLDFIKNDRHDDSKLILPKYSELSIKCISYLKTNSIVQASIYKEDKIKAFKDIITAAHNSAFK